MRCIGRQIYSTFLLMGMGGFLLYLIKFFHWSSFTGSILSMGRMAKTLLVGGPHYLWEFCSSTLVPFSRLLTTEDAGKLWIFFIGFSRSNEHAERSEAIAAHSCAIIRIRRITQRWIRFYSWNVCAWREVFTPKLYFCRAIISSVTNFGNGV